MTDERYYDYWNKMPVWEKAWSHFAFLLCRILPVRSRLFYVLLPAAGAVAYRDRLTETK